MMLKQGTSKEELRKFGLQYTALKKQINQIFGLNQVMLNAQNSFQAQVRTQALKRIISLIDNLKRMNKKHNIHLFCSLLEQVQTAHMGTTVPMTYLSKLLQSLRIFLKFKENLKYQGNLIWDFLKYFYFFQQVVKKDLPQFEKDYDNFERLRDFFARQYKGYISESISKVKEQNSRISQTQIGKHWQHILKLSRQITSTITTTPTNLTPLNHLINQLLKPLPTHPLQQMHLNNLKLLYQHQLLNPTPIKRPCCSVYFHKDQKLPLNSFKYNHYEDVKMPLNDAALNTIQKVMISFMNTDGGIHYIGIRRQENSLNVQGVWLSDKNLIDFFDKVYRIAHQIQPQIEIPLKQPPQLPLSINKKLTYFLQLTRFVSLQINPLIDPQHGNIDYIQQTHDKKNIRVCVIKIKVKSTPKYDTYIIKNNNKIQSYYRNNGMVEKITPSMFPKVFTERSLEYMEEDRQWGNPECRGCRHDYGVGISEYTYKKEI